MPLSTEHLAKTLKQAREARKLSQRDVAERTGIPQGHLSRVETGGVDPRISTLVEVGRSLGMELVWVPQRALPAVQAIIRSLDPRAPAAEEDPARQPAYRLDDDDG